MDATKKQQKMVKNESISENKNNYDEKPKDRSKEMVNQPEQLFELSNKMTTPLFAPEIDVTWIILIGIASAIRLYNLSIPAAVVFDEVHFGKFTSLFMKNIFFFDVHPPLGKLLFAFTGYLTGFDGSFDFNDIGEEIPADQMGHIYYLRLVPATFSILLVPTVYEIILELGCSYWFAIFGALLLCFENMITVQSKYILLDVPMLFFMAFSICCYIKFLKQYTRPFCFYWWVYLISLGVSLTATFSIKYNGFFSVLLIGGLIAYELWNLMGDVTVPAKSVFHHIVARVVCLIIIPICLYLLQFYVMFTLLYKSGPHDNLMSSAFQRTLEGGLETITKHQAEVISYGSQITLRNTYSKQCWLHSHEDLYPIKYPDGRGSSAQQQVTCYAFKDINNWWIIKHPDSDHITIDFPPKPVQNGDIIHLVHGTTGRGLNSHDVGAPLNPQLMEVSGYIDHNVSMDGQFGWRLEILNPDSSNSWKAIGSQIRLVHVNTSAAIKVSGEVLPDWGYHQFEVGTDRTINTQESIFNVEEHHQNITIPEGMNEEEAKSILSNITDGSPITEISFLQQFWELQVRMLKANSELLQEHTYASRPTEWLIMKKGVAYWVDSISNVSSKVVFYNEKRVLSKDVDVKIQEKGTSQDVDVKNQKQIFCLGNPFIWWVGTMTLMTYFVLLLVYLLRRRRQVYDLTNSEWNVFMIFGYLLVGGYFINYLPFFPVERTLFIHHYLPCLLYKIILIPVLADHVYKVLLGDFPYLQACMKAVLVFYTLLVIWCFNYFRPFTYGNVELSAEVIESKKWLKSWEFLSHT